MIANMVAWLASTPGIFVTAAAAVLLVGALAARVARSRRARRFRRARGRQVAFDPITKLPEVSQPRDLVAQAQGPAWFSACQEDLVAEDRDAARRQNLYHSSVARCVAVLSVGVAIMCVSVIIYRDSTWLKKFVTHFDLIAVFYALGYFVAARYANRAFVIKRSFIETLRAWMHLALIFPLEGVKDDVFAAYQAHKQAIADRLWARTPTSAANADGGAGDDAERQEPAVARRVVASWAEMHKECRATGLRQPASPAALGFYLKERPLEQLKFFITAQARIQDGQRGREWLMLGLYIASVALAVLKALSVFSADLPAWIVAYIEFAAALPVDWLSAALLVVMVLSAAATNAFISRNERSLLHSYHAQERRIRKWFETVAATSAATAGPRTIDSVLAFEEIMLNELLDFIHITSRDVIEVPR